MPPSAGATQTGHSLAFSAIASDAEFLRVGLFALPLVPLGDSPTQERQALAAALVAYERDVAQSGARDSLEALEGFLESHPDSAWKPALLVDLGTIYRQTGHFSRAFDTWQAAWELTKRRQDEHGRAIGDAAVAQLSQLEAYLGRYELLAPLLDEISDRPLRGTAAELISESSRGLADMRATPGLSFKCGPFALSRILQYKRPSPPAKGLAVLQASQSTSRGLSLSDVRAIAERAGMRYQMAFRKPGAQVIVPAVAHWKMGHYAALLDREQGRFRIEDATFGEPVRMSPATPEDEASGYFLVPAGPLPAGWRAVPAAEGGKVWGRGDTGNNKDNGATGPGEQPAFTSPSSACPGGCTTWNVEPMVVGLALHDVPVGHTVAVGPPVRFDVYYSHRDVQQPQLFNYWNMGRKWTSSFLSYVTDNLNVNGTVELYRRGGGSETFSFDTGATESKTGAFSQSTITRKLDASGVTIGFSRNYPDGSREEFVQALGTKFFMTSLTDAYGNQASLKYDEQVRLVSVSDALGQTSTLSYELADDPLKVTRVTDPFGRSATFSYAAGLLQTSTDTIGITSKYSYGNGDFVASLETPYGITRFEYGDSTTDPALGNTRFLNATDALGRTSRVEFRQGAPGISSSTSTVAPRGMNIQNDFLQWRNTFVWNPAQYAEAIKGGALDYTKSRILHWLHTADNSTSRVLESIKEPLEGRLWFDYPGQSMALYVGTSSQPLHVGRVLDDGTSQVAGFTYNPSGKVSTTIDPLGRTLNFEYAGNGLDLSAVTNVTAGLNEKLISATYDDKHRLSSVTSPSGATSRFEYNTQNQIIRTSDAQNRTTSYGYDERGNLVSVEGAIPLAKIGFDYDAMGRIVAMRYPGGASIRYEYDAADRRTRVTYPDGTSTEYTYRLLDLVKVKDRRGRISEFVYDAERQLTEIVDHVNMHAKLGYGLDGALKSITDPLGRITAVARDIQGRITNKTDADGSVQTFNYERLTSRLRNKADPLNQSTTFDYNLDDSVAQMSHSGSLVATPPVSFKYDPAYQRVISMLDGNGETSYSYHALSGQPGAGELANVKMPVAGASGNFDTIAYNYDVLNRVVGRAINGVAQNVGYDVLGRVSEVKNALDTFGIKYREGSNVPLETSSSGGPHAKLDYYSGVSQDGLVRSVTVTRPDGRPLAQFGYRYNADGQIDAFADSYLGQAAPDLGNGAPPAANDDDVTKGGLPLSAAVPRDGAPPGTLLFAGFLLSAWLLIAALAWRRRMGRPLATLLLPLLAASSCSQAIHRTSSPDGRLQVYSYDPVGRLTSASSANGATPVDDGMVGKTASALNATAADYSYAYDSNGNLTKVLADGESTDQMASTSDSLAEGRHDKNGNPLELAGVQFAWDAENRLVKVSVGPHESEFAYDGLGRAVRITEKVSGKPIFDRAYTWCGAERCLERDNLVAGAPVSKEYYGQGLIAGGQRLYYISDHLGSVRQLVDQTGRVRAQYDYEPYGRTRKVRGDLDSDIQYGGYFTHQPSGLQLAVYRAYDPKRGRWLNQDPLEEGGGLNRYAYAGGNPVSLRDPLGLWIGVDDLVAGGVGALVGVAVQGGFDLYHGKASSWQDYTAAAVGGAAGGVATLYGGPIAGGAVGGAAANLTRQGLNIATGKQCNFNWTSLAIETGAGAAGGVVAKGVGKFASGVMEKWRGPALRPATAQPMGGGGAVLADGQGATAAEVAASSGGPSGGSRVGQDAVRRELLGDVPPGEPYTCWRCGQTSTNPADMHVGHRNVPTSQGGNLDKVNVCLEGAACNLSAGNRGSPGAGMSCAERGSCGAPYGR